MLEYVEWMEPIRHHSVYDQQKYKKVRRKFKAKLKFIIIFYNESNANESE